MKYHGRSARPSTVGKTIRIRPFSATLGYQAGFDPNHADQPGKRIRSRRETKGKYDRRKRLNHVDWCHMVRGRAQARRLPKTSTSVSGGTEIKSSRWVGFVRSDGILSSGPLEHPFLSGGTGSKVDRDQMRTFEVDQVVNNSWPVRVMEGFRIFFARTFAGECSFCGNHSASWGFGVFGCHWHACCELERLRSEVAPYTRILQSLQFTDARDYQTVLDVRNAIGKIALDYVKLQERFMLIWGPFAFGLLPNIIRRGYTVLSMAEDLRRLGVAVGADDASGEWRQRYLPSKRQVVKSLAVSVLPRDSRAVLRELVGAEQSSPLVLLLEDPSQFILNTQTVKDIFKRFGEGGIVLRDAWNARLARVTKREKDAMFVIEQLYRGGAPPDFVIAGGKIVDWTDCYGWCNAHQEQIRGVTADTYELDLTVRIDVTSKTVMLLPSWSRSSLCKRARPCAGQARPCNVDIGKSRVSEQFVAGLMVSLLSGLYEVRVVPKSQIGRMKPKFDGPSDFMHKYTMTEGLIIEPRAGTARRLVSSCEMEWPVEAKSLSQLVEKAQDGKVSIGELTSPEPAVPEVVEPPQRVEHLWYVKAKTEFWGLGHIDWACRHCGAERRTELHIVPDGYCN